MRNNSKVKPKKRCIYTVKSDNHILYDVEEMPESMKFTKNEMKYHENLPKKKILKKAKPEKLCRRMFQKCVFFRPTNKFVHFETQNNKNEVENPLPSKKFNLFLKQLVDYAQQENYKSLFTRGVVIILFWIMVITFYLYQKGVWKKTDEYDFQYESDLSFIDMITSFFTETPPPPKSWTTQLLEYFGFE